MKKLFRILALLLLIIFILPHGYSSEIVRVKNIKSDKLLVEIIEEGEIFNKINSDRAALYTGVLSIILIIIPMALHLFYPERADD
jgi:hypothetical protein